MLGRLIWVTVSGMVTSAICSVIPRIPLSWTWWVLLSGGRVLSCRGQPVFVVVPKGLVVGITEPRLRRSVVGQL